MYLAGPTHSLLGLQGHSGTASKGHICRLGSDVVVAVQAHINLIGLRPESPSSACSAGVGLLTSTNSRGARLVVGRFLNGSLYMIHVPTFEIISDPLLPGISTELVPVAL